ncbi:hypothetical protein H0H81_010843 [Sphagnurus paluster]|uniref:Uncharacterized protein n=1 Tax=Sphagnurus paluster TaxID=117069 RepID=A0A9P7KIE8_9AGAR|nr:hypothetical protein H0H81_010843 [Sphagnurus paluster]
MERLEETIRRRMMLPANGAFTVELAVNRAFTTLSFNGKYTGTFGDGKDDPGLGDAPPGQDPPCITEPNIHAQNQSMAAGSAFAISYQSDLSKVTPENLVVFSVLHNSPWERVVSYSVPNLPACPPGGCICAWGWVPNGCGEPNMYMLPYRCKVVGKTGNAAVYPGIPATWCEDNPSNCTKGPRQMIYWNQLEGNNIQVSGLDLSGHPRSPAYNDKLGFANGAQTDIFMKPGTATPTTVKPGPSPLVVVALVYEGLGILMAWTIKQFFWVPHRFRYGILVAGGWGNVGDIRE